MKTEEYACKCCVEDEQTQAMLEDLTNVWGCTRPAAIKKMVFYAYNNMRWPGLYTLLPEEDG